MFIETYHKGELLFRVKLPDGIEISDLVTVVSVSSKMGTEENKPSIRKYVRPNKPRKKKVEEQDELPTPIVRPKGVYSNVRHYDQLEGDSL